MRIALVGQRRDRPSFRFRALQYLPYLEEAGHTAQIVELAGNPISRLLQYGALRQFDSVFIQQRLLHPWELAYLRRSAKRLVFDVDDAIMRQSNGAPDSRRMARFRAMCRAADLVICGNQFLADEARAHTSRIVLIPTTIELRRYPPLRNTIVNDAPLGTPTNTPVNIGWTGSRSTSRYLNEIFPTLAEFAGRIRVKLISDDLSGCNLGMLGDVPHEFVPWSPETEIAAATDFDIGVMPLPDQEFTRGKCGCKALQYMALGIPAICSPVGMNRELIQHGENGYLAHTPQEWRDVLEELVSSEETRRRVGLAGYKVVSEQFAAEVWATPWLQATLPTDH